MREQLREALGALGRAPTFDRFTRVMAPLLVQSLSRSAFASYLQPQLALWAKRSLEQKDFEPDHAPGLVLHDESGNCRFVVATPESGSFLTGSAGHRVVVIVSGSATVRRYRHERPQPPAIFDPTAVPVLISAAVLAAGEHVAIEAWRDIVEFEGDALMLVLESSACHTVRWLYDRHTRIPQVLVAATPQLSRIEDGLEMLAYLGETSDAEVCHELARHECHTVRWAAIKAAYSLDPVVGRHLLTEAMNDSHPEIRAAADAALAGTRGA